MMLPEAEALAGFINHTDGRYRAEALPMGSRLAWVILTDRNTGGNPGPVVDVDEYLEEMDERDSGQRECCRLLREWMLLRDGSRIGALAS